MNGDEHLTAVEYLHLTQVSEGWEPGNIPTNAHYIDKGHFIDKEAG